MFASETVVNDFVVEIVVFEAFRMKQLLFQLLKQRTMMLISNNFESYNLHYLYPELLQHLIRKYTGNVNRI